MWPRHAKKLHHRAKFKPTHVIQQQDVPHWRAVVDDVVKRSAGEICDAQSKHHDEVAGDHQNRAYREGHHYGAVKKKKRVAYMACSYHEDIFNACYSLHVVMRTDASTPNINEIKLKCKLYKGLDIEEYSCRKTTNAMK